MSRSQFSCSYFETKKNLYPPPQTWLPSYLVLPVLGDGRPAPPQAVPDARGPEEGGEAAQVLLQVPRPEEGDGGGGQFVLLLFFVVVVATVLGGQTGVSAGHAQT